MEKNKIIYLSEGVLRSIILTTILLLIYSVFMNFIDFSNSVTNVIYVVITLVSIIYGTVFAVKKINKKGWINGMIISAIYMLILFIISTIAGRQASISGYGILRVIIALVVGILSGMLGVNMGRE